MSEIRTLADACSFIVDCAHKTAPIHDRGAYFAVGTPAMRGNRIDYREARRITRETFEAWTERLKPRVGDLLLAREAPVGPVVRIPSAENVAPGQRTVLLRPRDNLIDPRFLYYYLISPRMQAMLAVKASGSTVPHLNVADVRALPTPGIPSMSLQQSIAEVLGALDEKIAANARVLALSAQLIRTRTAASANDGLSISIADITARIMRGITPRYTDGDGLLVINQRCVRDHLVDLRHSRKTAQATARADRRLDRDDVVVNSMGQGTLGRAARWICDDVEATVDSHITLLRFDNQVVDPSFAGVAVLELESQIEALAEGSTGQTELRRDLLGALQLRLPPLQVQREVGAEIRQIDKFAIALRTEDERLAAIRDELLPLLMSGKVRIRDAEGVVGDVL